MKPQLFSPVNYADMPFDQLAREIAAALGGKLLQPERKDQCWREARLDNIELVFRSREGRFETSVSWPKWTDEQMSVTRVTGQSLLTGDERKAGVVLDVSCALGRGARVIARDIERRLLPSAVPMYKRAVDHCLKQTQCASERAKLGGRLEKLGYRRNRPTDSYFFGKGSRPGIRIQYDGDIEFERFHCDEATAREIIAVFDRRKRASV